MHFLFSNSDILQHSVPQFFYFFHFFFIFFILFYRQDSDTFSWSSLFSINSIDGYGLMSNNNEGGFQLESPGSVSVVGGSCSHNNSNNLNNIDNNLNNDNENDDNNDGNDNNNDINENNNSNIIGNRIKIKDELITREDKHIKRGIAELGSTDGISYTDKNGEIREIRENGFRRQKLSTTYPPLTPQSIQSNQSNLSIVSTGTNSVNNNLGNNSGIQNLGSMDPPSGSGLYSTQNATELSQSNQFIKTESQDNYYGHGRQQEVSGSGNYFIFLIDFIFIFISIFIFIFDFIIFYSLLFSFLYLCIFMKKRIFLLLFLFAIFFFFFLYYFITILLFY